jgi:hypothetical protein
VLKSGFQRALGCRKWLAAQLATCSDALGTSLARAVIVGGAFVLRVPRGHGLKKTRGSDSSCLSRRVTPNTRNYDAMMGLREKGASSLRHQWQREGLGPGGRAALRVALSRLPPHVMSAPTMRRQGDNTPSNALCALYDASASVFTKNSARLRTLRHVPQASSVVDLSTPTVGEDVVFIAGHSASCDGGGLSPGSGSGVYQRGTLAGWPHVCGCASVVPPGGGGAAALDARGADHRGARGRVHQHHHGGPRDTGAAQAQPRHVRVRLMGQGRSCQLPAPRMCAYALYVRVYSKLCAQIRISMCVNRVCVRIVALS